jgi:2'-5' RNA ligase
VPVDATSVVFVKTTCFQTRRLFLALWPDDGVRKQLADHAALWSWPEASRPYAPADWHVTLQFIGNVAPAKVDAIAAAAAVPFESFELVLDQPRLWPHGLAVLCASKVPAPLKRLHERLGQALRELDFVPDSRPYLPHVTLARHAEASVLPRECTPVCWRPRGFAMVVSTGFKAPRYQLLRQYR